MKSFEKVTGSKVNVKRISNVYWKFYTQVKNNTTYIKKNNQNRNLVITGQYILKVMNRFIDLVKLEPKRYEDVNSHIIVLTAMLNRSRRTISKKPYQGSQLQ